MFPNQPPFDYVGFVNDLQRAKHEKIQTKFTLEERMEQCRAALEKIAKASGAFK